MKTSVILLIASFFIVAASRAQTTPDPDSLSPKARATALTQSMRCELGLNTQQLNQIQKINFAACQKMDEVALSSANNAKLLDNKEEEVERIWYEKLKSAMDHKQWVEFEKISNGDVRTLKMTSVCRKPTTDEYGGF